LCGKPNVYVAKSSVCWIMLIEVFVSSHWCFGGKHQKWFMLHCGIFFKEHWS